MQLKNRDILMPSIKKLWVKMTESKKKRLTEEQLELLCTQVELLPGGMCDLPYDRKAVITTLASMSASVWLMDPKINIVNQQLLDMMIETEQDVEKKNSHISLV